MDNPIVKILRFLVFFPICLIAMSIINWGLGYLIIWLMSLSKLWFFIVIIFLGGIIWGTFKSLASILVILAAYISPIKWLGTLTISVLALINGGVLIYQIWTLKEDYSGWEIFGAIISTILVIELTSALISGSSSADQERFT